VDEVARLGGYDQELERKEHRGEPKRHRKRKVDRSHRDGESPADDRDRRRDQIAEDIPAPDGEDGEGKQTHHERDQQGDLTEEVAGEPPHYRYGYDRPGKDREHQGIARQHRKGHDDGGKDQFGERVEAVMPAPRAPGQRRR
jgi:hypothetical protein